ncbi:hypothetical protein ACEWY4_016958 [Coilia grayii]|uniref:Ig-like domain-containing protein n=1 Tax=Coilia grayii TaxID=363190 RepID=A0ABD1JLV2_9TELE
MRRSQFPSRAIPERVTMPAAGPSERPDRDLDSDPSTAAPPVFLRKLKRAAVATGCDVRLRVAVGGHPEPELHWYRGDTPVHCDERDPGGLWIRDCQPGDGGLYTCVALNAHGEARSSAVLAVLDLGDAASSLYSTSETEDADADYIALCLPYFTWEMVRQTGHRCFLMCHDYIVLCSLYFTWEMEVTS